MKPIKIVTIKVLPLLDKNFDLDKDGVSDVKDCRPFNPRKQHITNTMKDRLEKLDIEVGDERGGPRKRYHVMSKDARKYAPKGTQQVRSVVSKFPQIVEKLEEESKYKPVLWEHFHDDREEGDSDDSLGMTFSGKRGIPTVVMTRPSSHYKGKDKIYSLGETTLHELRHVQQNIEREKGGELFDFESERKEEKEGEEYWTDINELDSRTFAWDEVKKRLQKTYIEGFNKGDEY